MSAVTALKFHGSQIAVLVGFTADSPAPVITGITQADPAVVSVTSHGLSDGDVVEISGVVGMTEVNNGRFIVDVLTSGTFALRSVDSTGYGAWVSGGTFELAEFSNFCNLTNYNQPGGTSPEIETTALCSTAQEYLIGLPDFGTTQIDYNFVRNSAIELALTDAYRDGSLTAVKVVLPEDHGTMVQMGFVQQMSVTAGVGGKWDGSLTLRNTGAREDFDAAP
jgi:hypothetical protein